MQYKQARQEEHQAIQEFTETELYKMTAKDPNILEQNQQERIKDKCDSQQMETVIERATSTKKINNIKTIKKGDSDDKVIQEIDQLHQCVIGYKQ